MPPDKVIVLTSADSQVRSRYPQRYTAHENVSRGKLTAECGLSPMDGLGIIQSQKVMCSVEVKVSSEHENLHTNPTRNQAQNHRYETPGFNPQHNQVPQCSYNTMLQVRSRPIMQ
jgi:hypothetical protein